jgi:transketolase
MIELTDDIDIFLFDLNNTIVNVELYHYESWLSTLKSVLGNNFEIPFDYFCEKFHPKDYKSLENYITLTLKLDNFTDLMIQKNKIYIDTLKKNKDKIKLIDGCEDFIKNLIRLNKIFIIVSDTYYDNIEFFIELFPILKLASKFYHRGLFNGEKFTKNTYLSIIDSYKNSKLCYITYYAQVVDTLFDKINVIYLNTDHINNVHYKFINENYSVLCIKDYDILNNVYLENKIINTIRLLSIDMINNAKSGHPGMPLGCAPTLYVLFCKIMNFNPINPLLVNRDRFILSNGHGCALLYSLLYLLGYNYTLDDLKKFRQINSITHGHPEYNPELGIEVTTGPLGQGIANGVGMAIASKKLKLDNKIYVMCGDGCLMEGISYEACSLAGHLELNNLILLYDDNGITIDGKTDITFTENIKKRFKSQNWNVLQICDGDTNINDIYSKLKLAQKSDKPTIIIIKTTIGYGSLKSGTSACHGNPLDDYNTVELKKKFKFDPNKTFYIDNDVKQYFKIITEQKSINQNQPNLIANNQLQIDDLFDDLVINKEKTYATRELSNYCLNYLIHKIDNIIVGSADLAESTKTLINSNYISQNNFNGKYLHYGIREHAMCAIANGISTFNIIPIVSTFLVFSNYCLASIRLSALSKHRVIYIFTHDSVFLGEDGPTHQPIESLTILRSIPNLLVFRPCNLNELCFTYKNALNYDGPSCIILTRQALPNININNQLLNIGAYIIYDVIDPEVILVSTGSEVSLSIEIAKKYNNIRVVSMYCTELFDKQSDKDIILPNHILKISIEAGSTLGWYKYVNHTYGIDEFGKSGKADDIRKYFKFTENDIIEFINTKLELFMHKTKKRKIL